MSARCDMAGRESYIESKVTKHAQRLGWRQRKMSFVGRRGCPDRWFSRNPGQLVIVEFKEPNGKLSFAQRKEIRWLTANGFNVHVIDNIADGIALFDSLEEAA